MNVRHRTCLELGLICAFREHLLQRFRMPLAASIYDVGRRANPSRAKGGDGIRWCGKRAGDLIANKLYPTDHLEDLVALPVTLAGDLERGARRCSVTGATSSPVRRT
jgi:hypothetical protein